MKNIQTYFFRSLRVAEVKQATHWQQVLAQAAQHLPAQGALGRFVHHNTLHAFESLPFDQALETAQALFGHEVYRAEKDYQHDIQTGRIRHDDLKAVIQQTLGNSAQERVAGLASRQELWLGLLSHPVPEGSNAEIQWLISTGNAEQSFQQLCPPDLQQQILADTQQWVMRELRNSPQPLARHFFKRFARHQLEHWTPQTWRAATLQLLWELCLQGGRSTALSDNVLKAPLRLRDLLWQSEQVDLDLIVNEVLIQFCASFCDQGLADWSLPDKNKGFFAAFYALYQQPLPGRPVWQQLLSERLSHLSETPFDPEHLLTQCLAELDLPAEAEAAYLRQTLLALPGWAGMLWQLETRPDRALEPVPPGTLMSYLALRLLLEACVAEALLPGPGRLSQKLQDLRQKIQPPESPGLQHSYLLFWLAQLMGWSPRRLNRLEPTAWRELLQALPRRQIRQRLLQQAYERRYRHQILNVLAQSAPPEAEPLSPPPLQLITCLDEREESLRRHLETLCPAAETFGTAGHFGVAMAYRGLDDLHDQPLCPPAVTPRHRVQEVVDRQSEQQQRWYRTLRRYGGRISYGLQRSSRGFWLGLLTHWLGTLMAVPLVLRVLLPALSAWLDQRHQQWLRQERQTRLMLRADPAADPAAEAASAPAQQAGFSVREMADIVGGLLRQIGLTRRFGQLIIVAGHGSSSLNNPHEAAYNCGACGGGQGGPNARAFAQMANDPEVRRLLADEGLYIPEWTVFLGALHNTCNDELQYADLQLLPSGHKAAFETARQQLQQACLHNAHERVRRFASVPLLLNPLSAWKQVHARARDLAQPRPEYGHAGNAFCFIGRRARVRKLFLDRRAFLVSYDSSQDPQALILSSVLAAVMPVCTGINLEYYFSAVDPVGWGAGTKLPHNITGLLGVMDGSASDLRTGLSRQMTEIHEPMRLLVLIESPLAALQQALARQPALERFCRQGWVQLACLSPVSPAIHCLEGDVFIPYIPETETLPEVPDSAAWYSGLREHLGLARLRPEAR